jgi:hypothetical protein
MAAPIRPAIIRPARTGDNFPRNRQRNDGRNCPFGGKPGKAGMALQRQNHAGKQRRQANHRQGIIADINDLAQDQARIEGRAHAMADPGEGKNGQPPGRRQEFQKTGAQRPDRIHAVSPSDWPR